jgi:flagella basal body P-ring formation protein FlgA
MKIVLLLSLCLSLRGACLPVGASRITASDIAAAVPAFAQLAPDTQMSLTPAPGVRRTFTVAELNQRLTLAGLEASATEPVCFERPMREIGEDELREAMLTVLPAGSDVRVVGTARIAVPTGTPVFPMEGLRGGVWRGHVEYEPNRRFAFAVTVDVRTPFTRVVATEAIRAGERITASKLRVDSGVGEPSPVEYASSLEEAANRVARRSVRAGAPVERSALGQARAIARGDTVQVDVVSGGAVLRFDGIAENAAAHGDVTPVRNPETGKIVHVRVMEDGRALLRLSNGRSE